MDPNLNQLLKWGVENSDSNNAQTSSGRISTPNAQALNALLGGPSDAELMKAAMSAITSADTPLPDKLIAFDNFEQLIESIDNANNMTPLELWGPLVRQMQSKEADLRRMAAWCVGTAVQNNTRAQECILAMGVMPLLVSLALDDDDERVRRKAVYALSSAVRNCQPALDAMAERLPAEIMGGRGQRVPDAGDMERIDDVFDRLRGRISENA